MIRFGVIILLSIISSVTVLCYLDKSSSIIFLLMLAAFVNVWIIFPLSVSKRFYVYNGAFSFLFASFTTIGLKLDFKPDLQTVCVVGLTFGLFCAIFPIVSIISKKMVNYKPAGTDNIVVFRICFLFVALSLLLVYLAVFPGIYTNDAPFWYRDFDDLTRSVSSKWSPVYAGLFYIFLHTGKILFDNYEYGLAAFTAIQSLFTLFGIQKILLFVQKQMGNMACIITALFFGLVPTHMIMTMQTAQGTPFMVCFAMIIIHLHRMINEHDEYWCNCNNYGAFILWSIGACLLRNNAYYVFIVFLVCVYFYNNRLRKKLFLAISAIVVFITIYNGPLLNLVGVSKGTFLQESLSMPLQQMACAYVQYPHKMTERQKILLEKFIPPKTLKQYARDSSISDVQKRDLNVKLVRQNFRKFINLYLSIGLHVPSAYLKAAYVQNLGLLYIDKRYQDTRIWHNLIDYINHDMRNPVYINIKRNSHFPLYDELLGKLFGEKINKNVAYTGYAGNTKIIFSSVPVLNSFCRPSTYFWCLVFLCFFAVYRKYKEDFLYLGMAVCFTLSVVFSPVILYRYYAPVIFAFPVIVAALLGERKTELDNKEEFERNILSC